MIEPLVVDAVQGAAAALGAGIIGSFGWLTSRLFSAWRHEIAGMKQVASASSETLVTAMEHFKLHMLRDEEIQTGMLAELKEMKGYLRGKTESDHAIR